MTRDRGSAQDSRLGRPPAVIGVSLCGTNAATCVACVGGFSESYSIVRERVRASLDALHAPRAAARGNHRGGADRDRTDDLRLAKPALSQLSYGPSVIGARPVGLARLELATSPLSGVRSNHLSYRPERQTARGRLPFGVGLELAATPQLNSTREEG